MKYRKKPVEIEAIQWTGDNATEIAKFTSTGNRYVEIDELNKVVRIETLEGVMTASLNDYIIRGVHGEFYPCKPDIFELTYEVVPEMVTSWEWLKSLSLEEFVDNLTDYNPDNSTFYNVFSGKHYTKDEAIRWGMDYLLKEHK